MTYRVFQWASGTVGRHAARVAVDREHLDLVGMHVLSADKIGRDIGDIIGCGDLGLPTTSCIDTIVQSKADVVIHAPLASKVYGENPDQDLEDICTLLAAGINVITVVGYMYPSVHGETVVQQIEDACTKGQSTFHSTGLNPGWLGDVVPLTMSALTERIDHIHVLEISNFQGYPSPEIMFESMGFGSSPETFQQNNQRRAGWLTGLFSESVQMVADGIGLGVTSIQSHMELALAETDLDTASGVVKQGTVAAQHWRWAGLDDNSEEKIVHETVWRMHESAAPDWAQGKHSLKITGSPGMFIEFEPDYVRDGLLATAMHAVNAIPCVVDAQPGIKTLLDLGWILPRKHD